MGFSFPEKDPCKCKRCPKIPTSCSSCPKCCYGYRKKPNSCCSEDCTDLVTVFPFTGVNSCFGNKHPMYSVRAINAVKRYLYTQGQLTEYSQCYPCGDTIDPRKEPTHYFFQECCPLREARRQYVYSRVQDAFCNYPWPCQ